MFVLFTVYKRKEYFSFSFNMKMKIRVVISDGISAYIEDFVGAKHV